MFKINDVRKLCLFLIAGFLIIEILLRTFDTFAFGIPFWDARRYIPDDKQIWKLNPGYNGPLECFKKININSDGVIGPVLSREKPANEVRILFLGGSVLFGEGVDKVEDTYWSQIESLLESGFNEKDYVILNASTPGYSSFNSLQFAKSQLRELNPDILIMGHGWNDICIDAVPDKDPAKDWRIYNLAVSGVLTYSRLLNYIKKSWRIISVEKDKVEEKVMGRFVFSKHRERTGYPARVPLEDFTSNLKTITEICRANSIHPIYITLPRPNHLAKPDEKILMIGKYNEKLRQLAKEINVPLADIDSVFSGYPSEQFFPDPLNNSKYPNFGGHQVMADIICRYIINDECINEPQICIDRSEAPANQQQHSREER